MGQVTLPLHPPSGYYLSTTQETCATKVDQLLPSALITLGSKGCCFLQLWSVCHGLCPTNSTHMNLSGYRRFYSMSCTIFQFFVITYY